MRCVKLQFMLVSEKSIIVVNCLAVNALVLSTCLSGVHLQQSHHSIPHRRLFQTTSCYVLAADSHNWIMAFAPLPIHHSSTYQLGHVFYALDLNGPLTPLSRSSSGQIHTTTFHTPTRSFTRVQIQHHSRVRDVHGWFRLPRFRLSRVHAIFVLVSFHFNGRVCVPFLLLSTNVIDQMRTTKK